MLSLFYETMSTLISLLAAAATKSADMTDLINSPILLFLLTNCKQKACDVIGRLYRRRKNCNPFSLSYKQIFNLLIMK